MLDNIPRDLEVCSSLWFWFESWGANNFKIMFVYTLFGHIYKQNTTF